MADICRLEIIHDSRAWHSENWLLQPQMTDDFMVRVHHKGMVVLLKMESVSVVCITENHKGN